MTTATFRLKRFLLKTMEIDKSLIHLKKKSIINHFCNAIDKLFKQIPGRHLKWFKINNSTEKITWKFSTWIFIRICNCIWSGPFCFYLFFYERCEKFWEKGGAADEIVFWLSFLTTIHLISQTIDKFRSYD